MPRPVKYRKVCHFPPIVEFRPINTDKVLEPVILCIEELILVIGACTIKLC